MELTVKIVLDVEQVSLLAEAMREAVREETAKQVARRVNRLEKLNEVSK